MSLDSDENLYILYDDGYCTKHSSSGESLNSGYFKDALELSSNYKSLVFSEINKNSIFVVTNKSIFKKDKDRFDKPIGSFNFIHRESNFRFIDTYYDVDTSENTIYVLTSSGILAVEDVDFYNHLYQTNKRNEFIDIELAYDDELEQDFVFNEKFQRLIFNHLLYYHLINKKPIIDYSTNGEEMFGGFITAPKKTIDINSYLIGINEVYSSSVFNRCIEKIYELQEIIIEIISPSKKDRQPITLNL
jgi:hypothetical protein